MANLFGMLASGAAQGYAKGSEQNTQIEQKYAMEKMDNEVKALMEERIHERNLTDATNAEQKQHDRNRADVKNDAQEAKSIQAKDFTEVQASADKNNPNQEYESDSDRYRAYADEALKKGNIGLSAEMFKQATELAKGDTANAKLDMLAERINNYALRAGSEKLPAADIQYFNEWKKDPNNAKKTFTDFYEWKTDRENKAIAEGNKYSKNLLGVYDPALAAKYRQDHEGTPLNGSALSGLPKGAVIAGRSKGKDVYRMPDGRLMVEE